MEQQNTTTNEQLQGKYLIYTAIILLFMIEETIDNSNQNNEPIYIYKIDTCEPFIDGRAWVTYYEQDKNQCKTYYYGFIDTQGNVLYSILPEDVKVFNIGKGSAIVTSGNGLILIDETGEVKMELSGHAEVKCYGNGFAWIYQNKSTITSLEHLYGVVNHVGEWIEPLQNLQEGGIYDEIEYIGDGFVGTRTWRGGVVYPIWNADKSVQITLDGIFSDRSIDFSNGMAFVSRSIHWADTVCITVITNEGKKNENTQIYEVSNDCIIFADGRVINTSDYPWAEFYDGKIVTNDNGGMYYQIIDYTKVTPVPAEFTSYPISQIEEFVFNGDYGLVQIRGLDEEVYVTMIDVQGNELITPIKGKDIDDCILTSDGYVYYKIDGIYHIVNKNNNLIKTDINWFVSFKGSGEIGMIRDYLYGRSYIKTNGENLFNDLKVQ